MKRLLPAIVAGLAGYCIVVLLAPRVNPYADLGYRLNRGEAIRTARRTASDLGLDTVGWNAYVQASQNATALDFHLETPDVDEPCIAIVRTEVRLQSPDGADHLVVTLSPKGDPIALERAEPETDSEETPIDNDETSRLASRGLRLLAGSRTDSFSLLGDPVHSDKGVELSWEARKSSQHLSSVKATVRLRNGQIVEARMAPVYSAAFQASLRSVDEVLTFLVVAGSLLAMGMVLAGFCFYVIGTLDRMVEHRRMFGPLAVLTLLWAASLLWGGSLDQIQAEGLAFHWALLIHLGLLLIMVVPTFLAVWGGGSVLAKRGRLKPWLTLDLLLEGNYLVRPVAASISAGILMGGALAAIQSLIAASGLFPGAVLAPLSPLGWVGRLPGFPGLAVLWEGPFLVLAIYFALLEPALESHVPKRIVSTTLAAFGAIALFSLWPFQHSTRAALVSAVAILLVSLWIHRRWGFLAVVSAGFAAGVVAKSTPLFLQPSSSLWFGGLWLSLGLAGLATAAILVAWRGREVDLEAELQTRAQKAADSLRQTRAVREKLQAEFAVARHAQELMLPTDPPSFPGFDLSTVCRPAREVGGDLFDFLPLQGDRWGVVVADVAGKGVPAALYMTLAKGLLTSISETRDDAREIALELNRHFHFSGRRSVFLTMALGVLDPAMGRVECVRAGHNPLIWRRSASDETIPLKPSGLGLGLAPNQFFGRSLEVETVQMAPGDALFFYSDGVTEAMNSDSAEYGDERLAQVIAAADGLSAEETRDSILRDLERFVGDTPASDDITLVVLRMRDNHCVSHAKSDAIRYPSNGDARTGTGTRPKTGARTATGSS